MNFTVQKIKKLYISELNSKYDINEINTFVEILFEEISAFSQTDLILKKEVKLNEITGEKFLNALERLKQNEPIQYITGKAYFYGLNLNVNRATLIPRQETEELVDLIIKENNRENLNVLDIGTGSGCIAISLAKNMNNAEVFAIDFSAKAIKKAYENARQNSVKVNFIQHDILKKTFPKSFPEIKFDIIVSNPPYIRESEKKLMANNVLDYEPESALFVTDNSPLIFYRRITEFAEDFLAKNGKLYFEINEAFGKETAGLVNEFQFKDIEIIKDINNKDRIVKAQFIPNRYHVY